MREKLRHCGKQQVGSWGSGQLKQASLAGVLTMLLVGIENEDRGG